MHTITFPAPTHDCPDDPPVPDNYVGGACQEAGYDYFEWTGSVWSPTANSYVLIDQNCPGLTQDGTVINFDTNDPNIAVD